MLDKREWVTGTQDHLRRALMLEPRGHADMYGAILTEPVSPGSHAGVLFMHNDGYSTMCGHGVIAVTTIALERGLLMPGGDGRTIVYDSPAGTIQAGDARDGSAALGRRRWQPRRLAQGSVGVSRVVASSQRGVRPANVPQRPSFVLHGALVVKLGSRQIRADVAFGGAFYAIVDSEAVGLPIDAAHVPELRRVGMDIRRAIETAHPIAHPLETGLRGIYGTIFTGPPNDSRADLRNVTVFADAQVDRSPCGTGTAAVMAVIDAMGLLADDKPFVHESLVGTLFSGRVAGRTQVGDYEAIVPEIEGSAWITGRAHVSDRRRRSAERRVQGSGEMTEWSNGKWFSCAPSCIWLVHSTGVLVSDRQPVFPRIRSTHQHAGLRIDQDALKAAERADAFRHPVTAPGQAGARGLRNGALDQQAVGAVMNARGLTRLLDVHAEVDQVHQHLRVSLRLVVAAHDAERQPRLAVLHDERRDERVQRPLVRRDAIGMAGLGD